MNLNKYHSKKTKVNGITFDSKAEAQRYCELLLLIRHGDITDLVLQPEYELIPAFKKNGKRYRKTVYKADFSYIDVKNNKVIVEDVKGVKTPVYRLKKKLFEYRYPEYEILEITK